NRRAREEDEESGERAHAPSLAVASVHVEARVGEDSPPSHFRPREATHKDGETDPLAPRKGVEVTARERPLRGVFGVEQHVAAVVVERLEEGMVQIVDVPVVAEDFTALAESVLLQEAH